jgi:hypothetical protein
MEFFAVITLQHPRCGSATVSATFSVSDGATRQGIYNFMREQAVKKGGHEYEQATVVFFSAEPNTVS